MRQRPAVSNDIGILTEWIALCHQHHYVLSLLFAHNEHSGFVMNNSFTRGMEESLDEKFNELIHQKKDSITQRTNTP
ncbi:hypothetical protein VNKP15269_C52930 (plasmid) [Klebsiella pneumoniae]|nr:hypothetical protein VNKP15269_C52930 [Klebsiella pneumoniae]